MTVLPQEILPALQGAFPADLVTVSAAGVPNAAVISQVYYVDPEHVALSFQFFNKTMKNIRENPLATVAVINPVDFQPWILELRFDHSESEGPLFDVMDMQLEAIASVTGMAGVFKLKAADVYRVEAVRKLGGVFESHGSA